MFVDEFVTARMEAFDPFFTDLDHCTTYHTGSKDWIYVSELLGPVGMLGLGI